MAVAALRSLQALHRRNGESFWGRDLSNSNNEDGQPVSTSAKEFFYCPVCGLKSPRSRPFCKDCGSNLRADYDFPFTYYETSENFGRLNDLTQALPTTRIVEVFLEKLGTPWVEAQQLGTAVRIGEKQFPDLYEAAMRCAEVLAVPTMPRIYINNWPGFFIGDPWPVYTLGTNKDPIVIISNSMANRITPDEFRFIMAREMGHIKAGHPLYSTAFELVRAIAKVGLGRGLGVEGLRGAHSMLGEIAGTLVGAVIIDQPLSVALNAWYREANYTADRAGILVVGDIEIPKALFSRLLMGWYATSSLSSQLNFDELLKQDEELTEGAGRFAELLGPLGDLPGPISVPSRFNPGYAMPYTVKRLRALMDFQDTMEYKQGRKILDGFTRGVYERALSNPMSESRFCGYCGASLGEGSKCTQCGRIQMQAET